MDVELFMRTYIVGREFTGQAVRQVGQVPRVAKHFSIAM